MTTDINLAWRVNAPGLLREVLKNSGAAVDRVGYDAAALECRNQAKPPHAPAPERISKERDA